MDAALESSSRDPLDPLSSQRLGTSCLKDRAGPNARVRGGELRSLEDEKGSSLMAKLEEMSLMNKGTFALGESVYKDAPGKVLQTA